jgi:hypothetical protein
MIAGATDPMTFWTPYILLLVLILAVLWGIYRLLRWRRKQNLNPIAPQDHAPTRQPQRSQQQANTSQAIKAQELQSWLENHSEDGALRYWFAKLSKREAQPILEDLSAFSQRSDFDLGLLLVDGYTDHDDLQKTLQEAVLNFLTARAAVQRVNGDLTLYTTYQHIIAGAGDAHTVKRLYAELVHRELAPPADPRILAASDDERAAYQLAMIREAAQKDWSAFMRVLHEIVGSGGQRTHANANRQQARHATA